MGNGFTTDPSVSLLFEDLLEHWESGSTKSLLRKAFGLILNISSTDQEQDHAQMVLETTCILLDEMNLGLESVLCCILKNVTDNGMLSQDAIDQEFGNPVRSLIEGIQKLERLDTSKYNTNRENFIGLLVKRGSSVLDFAFDTQAEKGSNCTGAIVNGKIVPIKHTLVNGDTVKILTSKTQKPNWGWLEIVKSPWNLTRVKQALKMGSIKETIPGIRFLPL
jgi:(p)ppGpp synthase/HD superfamily hydrolase